MRSNRPADVPDRDNWPPRAYGSPAETTRAGGSSLLLVLAVVAALVLCIAGFLVVRLLRSDSPPPTLPAYVTPTAVMPLELGTVPAGTPGQPLLEIVPQEGHINTLITVTGRGWWPEESVFVFLRTPEEGSGRGYAYAAAVTDDRGSFRTALTFPNEERWLGQSWATVAARGDRSGLEATARFNLVIPSLTATVPLPTLPPSATASQTPWPSDTPPASPTATQTPALVITDWRGEYFAGQNPAGEPVLVRNDAAIDFNWGTGAPAIQLPADQFSVRWTRQLPFGEGTHRFTVSADDGVRLWIDGELLIDRWQDGVLENVSADRYLAAGEHAVRLEYYENTGGAMVRLGWERVQAPTATATPTATPQPTAGPTSTPTLTPAPPTAAPPAQVLPAAWQGEYFANPFFDQPAAFVRTDAAIDFHWGAGSPGETIPADGFSVLWTGSVWLPAGNYRYSLTADDGARLWIDGQLILDPRHLGPGQFQEAGVFLEEGTHAFQLQFFELAGEAFVRLAGTP